MSTRELPKGWSRKKLGEISTIRYGKNLSVSKFTETGYPVFGANGIIGNFSTYLYDEEQVLISCRGAYSGKINWSPPHCYITNNSLIVEFNQSTKTTKRYIFYALQNANKKDLVTGTAQPQVTLNNAVAIEISIPPLSEQERIVERIESLFTQLDAGVAALKRAQAALKRYRASVLKAACEGRLVPQNGELNEQSVSSQSSISNQNELAELPGGWTWVKAEDICEFITKGTTPKADDLHPEKGDVPFIKVYNLTFNGNLDFSVSPTFIDFSVHSKQLSRSKVIPGDVLMNIVGPPLGKVSIVPKTYTEWNINQAIARFRPMPLCDASYLCIVLQNQNILNWAIKRAKATAGQFNLTLEICRSLPIPLPPIQEQHFIISEVERRLSVLQKMEATISVGLARASRLRQSILKLAFEGRLVGQEPALEEAVQEIASSTPGSPSGVN